MPSIRIGLSTDFNLTNEQVGINTTVPSVRLDVRGQILSQNTAGGSGISTLTTYDGFLDAQQRVISNISIAQTTKGNLNSLSGEVILDEEVTVTGDTPLTGGRLDSLTVTGAFDLPHGGTEDREDTPEKGSTRFNQDLGQLEFYTGTEWRTTASYDGSGRGRGVFGGGQAPTQISTIDYINISTLGNAINFGNLLTASVPGNGSFASSTRGIFAATSIPGSNVIEYITIASEGNSIDFGDLTQSRFRIGGGLSSSTRGIFGGGRVPTAVNTIDYVTIASIGNALDFGDLTVARRSPGGFSSPTRGIFVGGYIAPTYSNVIDFITISSTGNAVDFGDSIYSGGYGAGCSNSVRGFVLGGYYQDGATFSKTIGYVTIATTGNALDFGNLTIARPYASAVSSSTRGVCSNGLGSPAHHNVMDYITISTAGNAQDFGDSTIIGFDRGACSDSHGGLGGF